jgi:anti-anti-sigma factor
LLPDAGLRLERETPGAAHDLWLSGRINIESAPDLRALLLQRVQLPVCRILTVNCDAIVYVDIAGVAILLEILKAARLLGKQFLLKGLRERPRFLFEVAQLLHLFNGEGVPAERS